MDALYLYRYRHRCSSRGSVVIPGGLPDPIVVMYELYVVEQPPPSPPSKSETNLSTYGYRFMWKRRVQVR